MIKFFKISEILIFAMTLIEGVRIFFILNESKIIVPGIYAFIMSSLIGLILGIVFFKKEKYEYHTAFFIIKRTCLILSFFLGYMFMATEIGVK